MSLATCMCNVWSVWFVDHAVVCVWCVGAVSPVFGLRTSLAGWTVSVTVSRTPHVTMCVRASLASRSRASRLSARRVLLVGGA